MPPGVIPFPFGICRVCRDKATGVHYGVATCEGCKGFFKRTITRGDKYKCFFGGSCDIVPKNRNRCKSCRFKRCLETGMSVEAVRMGRIPKVEKEKALEVFQQTGSDYHKMEVLVQHAASGKYDTNPMDDNDGADDKHDDVEEEHDGTRTCTIHVTLTKNEGNDNKENPDTVNKISETKVKVSDQNRSQALDQDTNDPELDLCQSDSNAEPCKTLHKISTNSKSEYQFANLANSNTSANMSTPSSFVRTKNEVFWPEYGNTFRPQTSHPQYNPTEHSNMPGMEACAKGFTMQHSSMKKKTDAHGSHYSRHVDYSVPNLNETNSLHTGNLFSDDFDDSQRSEHCTSIRAQPFNRCPDTFYGFQQVRAPVPSSFSGSGPFLMRKSWGGNSTGTENSSFEHGQNCSLAHSFVHMQVQPGIPDSVNRDYRQDHREGQVESQFSAPRMAQNSRISYQPEQGTDTTSVLSCRNFIEPRSESSLVLNQEIGRPCPAQTPSSVISSISSKSSGRWSSYSPSLLKVLIEHVIESSEDTSIIERLKQKFSQINSDKNTAKTIMGILNDIVKKRKSQDHSSSQLSDLQQLPQSKSDCMENFLRDVDFFAKVNPQGSNSQLTEESGLDAPFIKSSLDSKFHSAQAFQTTESSNKQSRGVESSKRDTCSTFYSSCSIASSSDKSHSVGTKRMKSNEHMNIVSSSSSVQSEDEMEIKLTMDNMELAMKILYRLKPEHRQKLRLFKAGQLNLRVMTDSMEDVKHVYGKIMESIPQLNERILGFCENVRGFPDLSKSDQGVLLKRGFYDIWMLTFAEYFFDGESNIVLSTGELYSSSTMRKILNDEIVDTLISFSEKFNAFHLSDLEISILCAVQLTSSDGLTLDDPVAVQKLHSHMLDVLDYEMKRSHGKNYSRLLINIFKLLPLLSIINKMQMDIIANFPVNKYSETEDINGSETELQTS